jgi:hypothetical protein
MFSSEKVLWRTRKNVRWVLSWKSEKEECTRSHPFGNVY